MKITVEHWEEQENEVVLRCRELDEEMLWVLVAAAEWIDHSGDRTA